MVLPVLFIIFEIVEQSAVKAPAAGAGIPAKRIREVNGTKEKEDEPLSKKKRLEVAAKSSAVKVISYGFVSTILMICGSSHSSCICEESIWDFNCLKGYEFSGIYWCSYVTCPVSCCGLFYLVNI